MEDRKVPPPRRSNIDGITPRKPGTESQPPGSGPASAQSPPPQQKNTQQKVQAKPAEARPKSHKNILAIALAIIVLLILSALAVYTGLQQDSDTQKDSQQTTGPATSQEDTAEDTTQLINQTIDEIDQLSNKSDSSGSGLSDEKLGL